MSLRSVWNPPLRKAPSTASAQFHGPLDIAENVHVLGGTVNNSVGNQGIATPEGEPVRCGSAQRDSGHLAVQPADRH